MTKAMKKFGSLMLALVMIVVMMPALASEAFAAEDEAFTLYVNGTSTGKTITKTWMEENCLKAQVFPFPAKQGETWVYMVAEGPSYEQVLLEGLGIESLDEISSAKINWNNDTGEEQGKFDLDATDLAKATEVFKLVDQNDNDVTGAFTDNAITDVKTVKIDGAKDVTPIVTLRSAKYDSYEAAVEALDGDAWKNKAGTDIGPLVGGLAGETQFLKKGGSIKMGMFNFTGKFNLKNMPQLNCKFTIDEPSASTMKFTSKTAKKAAVDLGLPKVVTDTLVKSAEWTSSNPKVATVSAGTVKPGTEFGKTTVTAKLQNGNILATVNVTVDKKAFAPAKPGSFKATNVKTRKVKMSWKKVSGASGYYIYRSTKKSSGFKKIKAIYKGSTVKYTTGKYKKSAKGKTYYFKVKAYKTVKGEKIFGSYSTPYKVKIKK